MQPLTARLTADATVKTFDNGRSVVNFNVVKNRRYKNKDGERVTVAQFYECSYWVTPNIAPYLTKGQIVELLGDFSTRAYLDKQGLPQAVLCMNASYIDLLSPKKETVPAAAAEADANDDLPF